MNKLIHFIQSSIKKILFLIFLVLIYCKTQSYIRIVWKMIKKG